METALSPDLPPERHSRADPAPNRRCRGAQWAAGRWASSPDEGWMGGSRPPGGLAAGNRAASRPLAGCGAVIGRTRALPPAYAGRRAGSAARVTADAGGAGGTVAGVGVRLAAERAPCPVTCRAFRSPAPSAGISTVPGVVTSD